MSAGVGAKVQLGSKRSTRAARARGVSSWRRCVRVAGALLALAGVVAFSPLPAQAAGAGWWDRAPLQLVVHEHTFHRVSANAIGCKVRVRLYFDAPRGAYAEAAPARNHYRFRAEVKLSGGNSFVSSVFDNAEPGARVFAFTHDTAGEGCWAEAARKLRKVDVHACRGERCTPAAFD